MKEKSLVIVISLLATLFIGMTPKVVENTCNYSMDINQNNKCIKHISTDEQEIKKLMIVAHPDDETIFGGGHLLQEKYTVVCITCGTVDYRVKEFEAVMQKTNDDYIMLGFTDRINKKGPISNWYDEYNQIYNTIKSIIDSEEWDTIITHNPDGEYGHIHHKMTSNIVSDIADKNKLYYFGHWYKEGSEEPRIDDNLYNVKVNELISIYSNSQGNAIRYNYDMLPYENWIKATEW